MSLGWLNLQDYLEANQGSADDMAQRLEDQDTAIDQQGSAAVQSGSRLSYGQYLAKRRTQEALRAKDSGRAALLGGDIGDSLLAREGRATAGPRSGSDWNQAEANRAAAASSERDYWDKQAARNKGLASANDDARVAQDKAYGSSFSAWDKRNTEDLHRGQGDIEQADRDANAEMSNDTFGGEAERQLEERRAAGRAAGGYLRERQGVMLRNQGNFRRPGGK